VLRASQQLLDESQTSDKDGCATRAVDEVIWNYAREHDFVIISKDSDFRQRCFLFGPPPKVV